MTLAVQLAPHAALLAAGTTLTVLCALPGTPAGIRLTQHHPHRDRPARGRTAKEQHMTEKPYTDADLIAEAARQHAELAEDPDFMNVGERMQNADIASRADWSSEAWWHSLPREEFIEAQRKIDDLIGGAADVSTWAVQLGADGLEPEDHTLSVDGDGKPLVRLHCAFHPDLDDAARSAFMLGLARTLADGM